MKKTVPFQTMILVIWALIMCASTAFTLTSPKETVSHYYDTMKEAALLAQRAMQAVRQYKVDHGIPISEEDILDTGMLGDRYTSITTTVGVLEAKRTTFNPNWAAVIVNMFAEAGLKEGDQVGMVFSGSFPALNICAMAAAQTFGVDVCIMASVGASSYGANNVDFTFFDMAEYLFTQGILTNRIRYMSYGGADDVGLEFADEDKENILQRIENSGIEFIEEKDFHKNVRMRIDLFEKHLPDMKFFLNVGGSLVGMGSGLSAFSQSGYVKPGHIDVTGSSIPGVGLSKDFGLLEYYHASGIPVANLLNIKGIALEYGIEYDPVVMPPVGEGKTYYSVTYNLTIPYVTLVIFAGIMTFYCIHARKNSIEVNKNERNYILCGR